jgi:O-antigen/teichoic acid export membrane protein
VLEQIRRNLYKSYSRPISSLIPDEIIRPILLGLWVWLFHISDSSTVIILYIAVTLSLAIGFLGWLYRHLKQALSGLRPKYETKTWLKTALPMAYGSIGYLMMNQTDAIMLGMFEKMHVVGVYMASNRIAMLSQIILGSAAIIVVPMITAAFHGGRMNEFYSILSHTRIWIVSLTLPLFLVMVFFPNPLLKLFGDAYSEGEWVLRILAMGQFVNAAAGPLGLALTMTGRQSLLAKIMLLAAVLKIGLNIVIIPLFSAVGAATVTMCCLILLNFALFIIIKKSISFVDSTSGIAE